jgi:hypothetical protein
VFTNDINFFARRKSTSYNERKVVKMFKKLRNMTSEEKDELVEKAVNAVLFGSVWLVTGYIIGRFTCVNDLQNGKLDMFIPKN